MSSCLPKVKVWGLPSTVGPGAVALAVAAWMASVRRPTVAQVGGGVLLPVGPSRRMTAWKWTAPRFWYSATLAKETRAWWRKARWDRPARLAISRPEVDREAPP